MVQPPNSIMNSPFRSVFKDHPILFPVDLAMPGGACDSLQGRHLWSYLPVWSTQFTMAWKYSNDRSFNHVGWFGVHPQESSVFSTFRWYPSEKYEFVNLDDDIANIWKNIKCSSHHQPAIFAGQSLRWILSSANEIPFFLLWKPSSKDHHSPAVVAPPGGVSPCCLVSSRRGHRRNL